MPTRFAERADGRIAYEVEGTGPTVLMIPSLGRGASDFVDLAHAIAEVGFRAVRMQPRGIGDSIGIMQGVTMADLAEDAASVIADVAGTPAVVIGHAFGQRVARSMAARHPAIVRALVMLAAGGRTNMLPGAEDALAACYDLALPDAARLAAIKHAFFADGYDPAIWLDGWYPIAQRMQMAANRTEPVDVWWSAGSSVQILVVQGLQDTVAPPDNGRLMLAEAPDRVELVELDGAGHALLPEQPDAIAHAVIAFLKRTAGEGSV